MNTIVITTGNRVDLLKQTLDSWFENAADIKKHTLTIVSDGGMLIHYDKAFEDLDVTVIRSVPRKGASASRNIGAGSIPRYRRQEHVLFLDDDIFMCNHWDARLMNLARWSPNSIISGYSHPFNQCEPKVGHNITERDAEGNVKTLFEVLYGEPLVISSVAMMMQWPVFDEVGPWDEPGGPGASEDFALCMRAKDQGYGFAVTDPQCVIHTGLISSKKEAIVGYKELCEQNDKLLDFYNIRGRVIFQ